MKTNRLILAVLSAAWLTAVLPASAQVYQRLVNFGSPGTGGVRPDGPVLEASDGLLYGVTQTGGSAGRGTLYRVDRNGGGFALLHQFPGGAGGHGPRGGLLEGPDGLLYGVTELGGTNNYGVAFRVAKNGGGFEITRHFAGDPGPAFPQGGLVLGSDGQLYGFSEAGGSGTYYGTIFRMSRDGSALVVLANFNLGVPTIGASPSGPPRWGSDGRLYGVTLDGGQFRAVGAGTSHGYGGTLFSYGTNGTGLQVLHHFGANATAPNYPYGRVWEGTDGNLYGTTRLGGTADTGTLYRIGKNGSGFTVLHEFVGAQTGPEAGVLERGDGSLVGATRGNNSGALFQINKNGSGFTVLHSFGSMEGDGLSPKGEVALLADGSLVGVTEGGGLNFPGSIFAGTMFAFSTSAAPGITTQPASTNVIAGSNAVLSVVATGSIPLAFQWQLANTNLPGATTATLALNAITPAQAGPYRVIITNAVGAITSAVAQVTVLVPPSVPVAPTSITTNLGGSVTFTVTPAGTPPFTYQWRQDGTNVPGATSATLTLANTAATNAGAYTVVISNAAGSITNGAARLTFTDLQVYAGLTIIGPAGSNYRIDYTNDLSGTPAWTPLTNLTLPTSVYLFVDTDSPGRAKRFYRAVPVD